MILIFSLEDARKWDNNVLIWLPLSGIGIILRSGKGMARGGSGGGGGGGLPNYQSYNIIKY